MRNHEKWENWLSKASGDLRVSKILLREELLDTAIYHTQQCAEKALKGYLVYHKQAIKKTHDLTNLLEDCINKDSYFYVLEKEAASLNPYATAFRYSDDFMDPEKEEVVDAIEKAKKILNFVKKKIEELEAGQKNIFD